MEFDGLDGISKRTTLYLNNGAFADGRGVPLGLCSCAAWRVVVGRVGAVRRRTGVVSSLRWQSRGRRFVVSVCGFGCVSLPRCDASLRVVTDRFALHAPMCTRGRRRRGVVPRVGTQWSLTV
jgi:hypothetical protein